jgi:uncharacterized protein
MALRYPRILHQPILRDLGVYPVVTLLGPRQVGKTTLCREIAEERGLAYRTLDESDVRRQALEDPEGLLGELGEQGAVIDEIQRAPDLLLAVKSIIDRDDRPGRYLLTGSNQPDIGRAVGDSLLGRTAYRTLRPLTQGELRFDEEYQGWSFLFGEDDGAVLEELARRAASSGALDWREAVTVGGFPRAVAAPAEHRIAMIDDHVRAFVQRDIRAVMGVEDVDRFEAFFRVAAAFTGQELNIASLSRDVSIAVRTGNRWIDALQRTYVIDLVPAYSRNSSQKVIKAPKLYLVDPAFALVAARDAAPTGFHLENLVVADAAVWRDEAPGRAWYHWRRDGKEVDLILEEHRQLLAIEVKAKSEIGWNDARHLRTFMELHKETRRGIVLSSDPEIQALGPDIIAAPWWAVI